MREIAISARTGSPLRAHCGGLPCKGHVSIYGFTLIYTLDQLVIQRGKSLAGIVITRIWASRYPRKFKPSWRMDLTDLRI